MTLPPRRRAAGLLAILPGLAVLACAGVHTPGDRDMGTRTAPMSSALLCDELRDPKPVTKLVASGDGKKTIKFPESHSIAVLHVPAGAVSEPTTFVLSVESGVTRRALVNIEARQGDRVVTTLSRPLELELRVRSGCKPSKPGPDSSFYVFTMNAGGSPGDTTLVEGHGDYDDPPFWKPWEHRRVTADLNHLSGYILAQGIVR